jgi:hypothetical protein
MTDDFKKASKPNYEHVETTVSTSANLPLTDWQKLRSDNFEKFRKERPEKECPMCSDLFHGFKAGADFGFKEGAEYAGEQYAKELSSAKEQIERQKQIVQMQIAARDVLQAEVERLKGLLERHMGVSAQARTLANEFGRDRDAWRNLCERMAEILKKARETAYLNTNLKPAKVVSLNDEKGCLLAEFEWLKNKQT